jgi:hypothetical protein
MTSLDPFLLATTIVDWEQPEVLSLARRLARGKTLPVDVTRSCFEWVRDEVAHTVDHRLDKVTCSASEVLRERTGFCYAKSHLLAALLRANGIAAGFVYQRLALGNRAKAFCLHGLNAVWLPVVGWYRLDARGNRDDLQAGFDPPLEQLPFSCVVPGEQLFSEIWAEPLRRVVEALKRYVTRPDFEANLPDASDVDLKLERLGRIVAFRGTVQQCA